MPYIKQNEREQFDLTINTLIANICSYAQFTYVIYALAVRFFNAHTLKNWDKRTEVLKCLRAAHHEFERNYIDKYEDKKIKQNGDIL